MPELEHVPTLPELHARRPKLAEVVAVNGKGEPTHYRATPEGQQLIYDAMARNAPKARENDEQRRAEAAVAELEYRRREGKL